MNYFAFLRGINVGGHNMLRMADLKNLCTSLGYNDVRTVLQSGNVIFRTEERDMIRLAKRIEKAIEGSFGAGFNLRLDVPHVGSRHVQAFELVLLIAQRKDQIPVGSLYLRNNLNRPRAKV